MSGRCSTISPVNDSGATPTIVNRASSIVIDWPIAERSAWNRVVQ